MSDPDIILVSQSNVVDYDAYSKLPLDRLDLFKSLVYPRMVHHEGEFRSHLDYLNFKAHGKAYAAADYSERRRMLNIWNLPSASGVHLANYLSQFGFDVCVINNIDSEWDIFEQVYRSCRSPPLVGISSTFYLSWKEVGRVAAQPDLVWIFTTGRDIRIEVDDQSQVAVAVAEAVRHTQSLWTAIRSRLDCTILQNNADVPPSDSLGNFAAQTSSSRRNLLRLYNLELGRAAPSGVLLYDLEHFSALHGKERWADTRYWYHSKHAFALDAYGKLAFHTARLLTALKGRARKCLVLDLDNTLWGGVIGDDGLAGIRLGNGADGEAFADFQRWLRAMKDRGVILAVCSKNERDTAMEPFRSHPDCVLKLDDIAVFVANWINKADNIREIAATLNIGLDSLVFVDDNAVERDFVRTQLPEVAVPDLPEDPAGYIDAIERHHYFETASLSAEDRVRAQLYRENAKRAELRERAGDITGYLRSLDMVCESGNANAFHLPRMAQLISKSNQFHLTGNRHSEAELKRLAGLPDYIVRYFKLRDRIGDNGLISVIVLLVRGSELHVDTWVMSCRVLGRTMEEFVRNNIVDAARGANCRAVIGRYLPSAKNKLVAGLYQRLGFEKIADCDGETTWRLAIDADTPDLASHVSGALARTTEVLDVA